MTATVVHEPVNFTNSGKTPFVLPAELNKIKKANDFPSTKLCWNSNEEVFSILISFDKHKEWFTDKIPTRPPNGSMFLFNRQEFKDYRKDGFTWKKRTKGTTTREDHHKLKVQGINCVHVLYTHSEVIPSFHRRFYWLIQNPDVVLVHYVNITEDLTDPVCSYITALRKENILEEIESIYSGVPEQYKPDIEVTAETVPPYPPSPSSAPARAGEFTFKICITPKSVPPKKTLHTKASKWALNGQPTKSPNILSENGHQGQQGTALHWMPVSQKVLPPGSVLSNPNSQNISHTSNQPYQISTWIIPTCQPAVNQYLTTSGTVTSSINVPIGYRPSGAILIPKPPINAPVGENPQNSTPQQGAGVSRISASQPNHARSANPTFLVSASLASRNNQCRTSEVHEGTTQSNSTGSHVQTGCLQNHVISRNVQSNVVEPCNSDAPLLLTLTPTSTVTSAVNNSTHSSLGVSGKEIQSRTATPPTTPQTATPSSGTSVVRCDSLQSSSTSSIMTQHSNNAIEPGTSPSSDYGSYISEAGTRLSCSGSESSSEQCSQSASHDGMFDGPFRVPAAPAPDHRHLQSLDAHSWGSNKPPKPGLSDSDKNNNHNDSIDSPHLVDLGFDVSELSPLGPFGEGMLSNYDLSSVFPEYFDHELEMSRGVGQQNGVHYGKDEGTLMALVSEHNPEDSNDMQIDSGNKCEGRTTSLVPSLSTSDSSSPSTSITVNCQSPLPDVVMTTADATPSNNADQSTAQLDDKSDSLDTPGECCMTPTNANESEREESPTLQENSIQDDNQSAGRSSTQTSQAGLMTRIMPGSARITDFSPEWSYPEGRVKILVTGEWYNTDMAYTCLFDGCSVEATLVQLGALRCYCPPHEPGLVTLQVACNGFIVSNACVFEYRACDTPNNSSSRHEWLAMDESRFKLALLDRLERLQASLGLRPNAGVSTAGPADCATFEDRVVRACKVLFTSAFVQGSVTELRKPYRGMSLLHLAAALGFTKLIRELRVLKPTEESNPLSHEIDYSRRDEFSCTPLMWACGLGHREAVSELLRTDINSLLTPDARGRMPLQLARDRGYFEVVDCIEEFFMDSPRRQFALMNGSMSDDEDDIPPRSPVAATPSHTNNGASSYLGNSTTNSGTYPSNATTPHGGFYSNAATPASSYYSNTPLSTATQETTYTDRACSPMAVEESQTMGVPLSHALVQVHAMINEVEFEADLESSHLQSITGRVQGQLSPVHEESELHPSASSWVSSGGGMFRSFSSASSQSSPLTPSSKSSLSPGSPGNFLNSPHSSPAVAPDTKEFHEFLCSSKKLLEKNFSELTLTDREQRELYEAALIIQEAYRSYKNRRQQREDEMQAAVLIQSHYRRYKQYAMLKKMTQAALIIQNQYRAYREHEQFKKSRRAAAIIQNHFRIYRKRRQSQKRREEYKNKQQEARFMRQASNRSNSSL